MSVSVIGNGLTFIESGCFNLRLENSCGELTLNYNGLNIKILTKSLKSDEFKNINKTIEASIVEKDIIFTHHLEKIQGYNESGLFSPTRVGVKPDGGGVYLSWSSKLIITNNLTEVVVVIFSIYEGV
ncbi:hypothetical protein RKE85_001329 [Serratia marcescens]|nr:hypothetical protein [Serratia marcescens]